MSTGMQYMNGQPQPGYGIPPQGFPSTNPPPGGLGQAAVRGPWPPGPPGPAAQVPGVKQMPLHNGTTVPGAPVQGPSLNNQGIANQPPMFMPVPGQGPGGQMSTPQHMGQMQQMPPPTRMMPPASSGNQPLPGGGVRPQMVGPPPRPPIPGINQQPLVSAMDSLSLNPAVNSAPVQQPGPPAAAPGMYPQNPTMPRWGPPPGPPSATGFPQQTPGPYPPTPASRAPGEQPGIPPMAGPGPYTDVPQGPRPPLHYPGTMPPPQQPVMPPPNPGPQATMNMGFVPTPVSDAPTQPFPGVAGQSFSQQPPHFIHGVQRFQQPMAAPAGPHGPLNASSGPVQQPPARRLDPDQMPSPIQVMEDDKKNRSGVFQTGQKGVVPPLVTTDFIAEDQGMCSPRFLRSTMYNLPCTNDILKQTHMPIALTLTPFAQLAEGEMSLPVVDLGQLGPVRCNRCKAYMSPYMMFTDGGRKFQCVLCTCNTEVPPEYFNHLDHTGRRVDCYDRPELCLGAYEFVATADYCKDGKLPLAPAYIFMIDVSYQSVKSGLVNLLCTRLKDLLANLPKDAEDLQSEIRVGFVTYSNVLHFYNIKGSLAQPQMLVVSDIQDVFVPLLDGFLVTLAESEAMIDMLMSQIAQMFSDTRQTEVVLGPVIQAGLDALRSANRPGKLFIFHSSLPSTEAPGKLKGRDDRNLLGTDKEKTILSPQTNFYTKLGQDCVAAGCSVDLFLFPNSYIDVATVSEVCRLTGGNVHKYQYFQADINGEMVADDLKTAIGRPAAFDAVIRVRTSTGIRAVDFFGNFYMSNTTDVEMACVGTDSSICVEIKHDDKLSEAEGAYVQAAILYTSVGGRRRLRVLNTAFNTCSQIADMFRSCELDTYINFIAKRGIRECLNSNSRQVRDNLIQQCAQILACYRKNCASPSSAGQLILPECMKLLPLYINCVIKAGFLQAAGEITTDDRSYDMHLVNAMDVSSTNVYFYPQLIPLHEVDVNSDETPAPMRCSIERLRENGIYLLDNGLILFLWVGIAASVEWVRSVLGVPSIAQIDIDKTRLQDFDNPLSIRVRGIINAIRAKRKRHMKLVIVRQRDKLEPIFMHYLMEDRGASGSSSYVDFLCHIHKEIRNLLS